MLRTGAARLSNRNCNRLVGGGGAGGGGHTGGDPPPTISTPARGPKKGEGGEFCTWTSSTQTRTTGVCTQTRTTGMRYIIYSNTYKAKDCNFYTTKASGHAENDGTREPRNEQHL